VAAETPKGMGASSASAAGVGAEDEGEVTLSYS
jgi:hypothetical protein